MTDKLTASHRSWNMSRIKGGNTSLEMRVRKFLFKEGFRYRLKYKLTGKPDIVFPKKKTALFINGCFWHQHHNCKLAYMPKSNTDFWKIKLGKNVERDKIVRKELIQEGWKTVTIWECELEKDFNETMVNVVKGI